MGELQQYKIIKKNASTCKCSPNAFVYILPNKVEEDIISFLSSFGKPACDFKTTSILKIERPNFIITAIRRLREIRFTIKKESKGLLELFESSVINYVRAKEKK